jgi:hypothetical protein
VGLPKYAKMPANHLVAHAGNPGMLKNLYNSHHPQYLNHGEFPSVSLKALYLLGHMPKMGPHETEPKYYGNKYYNLIAN